MAVRYWSEEGGGHWVHWPAQPGPGLHKAVTDEWALDETGTLVQVMTGIELVDPA